MNARTIFLIILLLQTFSQYGLFMKGRDLATGAWRSKIYKCFLLCENWGIISSFSPSTMPRSYYTSKSICSFWRIFSSRSWSAKRLPDVYACFFADFDCFVNIHSSALRVSQFLNIGRPWGFVPSIKMTN